MKPGTIKSWLTGMYGPFDDMPEERTCINILLCSDDGQLYHEQRALTTAETSSNLNEHLDELECYMFTNIVHALMQQAWIRPPAPYL